MKNFVQNGKNVDITAPYAVVSGGGVLVGALFGVAIADIASTEVGTIATEGVYTLTKATGAGTNGDQGAVAYWDNTAKKVTGVATNNTAIGKFLATAATADTVATVRLNG
jgi:predicted RecA/RadA family phage recombinase